MSNIYEIEKYIQEILNSSLPTIEKLDKIQDLLSEDTDVGYKILEQNIAILRPTDIEEYTGFIVFKDKQDLDIYIYENYNIVKENDEN